MIEIRDLPWDAVAIPGRGEDALQRLIGAHVIRRIVDLMTIAPLAATLAPERAKALDALASHTIAMQPEEAIVTLREPRTAGIIARIFSALAARNAEALQRLLSQLPAAVPALRAQLGTDWTVCLEAGESIATDPNYLVRNTNEARSEIRLNALKSDSRLKRETRVRMTHGSVELFNVADVPELSERRLPGESPSPLSTAVIERELTAAFAAIELAWPQATGDVRTFFRGMLAMEMPPERWHSASTGEYPGVLQLTVRSPGEPLLLAESIIHEVSHSKLDVAMGLEPLLLDDGERRFRHPWRPDLRPITGVLLGAHAFLAVLVFYRHVAKVTGNPLALREVENRKREVGSALDTLAREATFTENGWLLFQTMRDAHAQNDV